MVHPVIVCVVVISNFQFANQRQTSQGHAAAGGVIGRGHLFRHRAVAARAAYRAAGDELEVPSRVANRGEGHGGTGQGGVRKPV